MANCTNGTNIGKGGCLGHCPKCKLRFGGSLCWGPSCHCPEMAPLDVDKLMLLVELDINPEDAAKTLLGEEDPEQAVVL